MHVSTLPDPSALAAAAAHWLSDAARAAIAERGRFTVAFSGGSTPWGMLRAWAEHDLDWGAVHVFQVDERRAPAGSEERNWTQIERCLTAPRRLAAGHCHPMPVEAADSADAAAHYARALEKVCGAPPRLDVVQLGLGDDGHTASLVPGDAVLEVADRDVAWTVAPYRGTRRMTLTAPCLGRARGVLWLVAGAGKATMVQRLRAADRSIPAGRIEQGRATLLVDAAAAGQA